MSLVTYKAFVDRMISKYEGGYGWDQKDPGGPTKYGITCYDLAEYYHETMNSMSAWAPRVKAMELSVAEAIYATKYAAAIRYNDLPAGIDVTMMDYGVNSGTSRAIRSARAILNVPGNGLMDVALLSAIKKTDPAKFINAMDDERLHFMHGIRGGTAWAEFGGGWGRRVADLRAYATHLIAAPGTVAEPTAPDLSNVSTPKATHVGPTKKSVATKTAAGAGGTAATHAAGAPLELALILAGFAIVGGFAYYFYQQQQAAIANATVVLPPPANTNIPPPVAAAA